MEGRSFNAMRENFRQANVGFVGRSGTAPFINANETADVSGSKLARSARSPHVLQNHCITASPKFVKPGLH